MAAARLVAEEVLGSLRQTELLALRRSALPATPCKGTRKSDLIADLAGECDVAANRQRIFAEGLGTWTTHQLRLCIARLKGLGYMVAVGKRPRQQDLIAAIVNTTEYAASALDVSKRTRSHAPMCKDLCSSTGSSDKHGPRSEGTSQGLLHAPMCKDMCSSTGASDKRGPRSEGASRGLSARKHNSSTDSNPAMEPSSCMVLVALDSAAAPAKLQQKLRRRWYKKWARFTKKQDRKHKWKRLMDELRKALQDHQATATVGELRALVGQALGLPMDGKYRWRFDKALSKLTSPPPKRHRARRRFTIAEKPSRRRSRAESA